MPDTAVADAHVPLAEVVRGGAVESVHYGAVAVVDRDGNVLLHAGDPHTLAFTRSSLKPLQALPFVAGGGVERFGFSQAQVALMCASHSGEPRHVEAVADMLKRCGCSADDLQCGTHAPGFYDARGELPPPPPYSPLQHNCSGKHAGMLAYCVHHKQPTAGYLAFDHPLQRAIRTSVSTFRKQWASPMARARPSWAAWAMTAAVALRPAPCLTSAWPSGVLRNSSS